MFLEENPQSTNQPSTSKKVGRTPQLSNPSKLPKLAILKKSTRLAIYLYIQAHYRLDHRQIEFIAHFQAKLNLAQIQSALKFMHILTTDVRTRSRMHVGEHLEKEDNVRLVPFTQKRPSFFEQRRIGVGYRDKGSLPKLSKMRWDKVNERVVPLEETAPNDFTLLCDLLGNLSRKDQLEVKSKLRENHSFLSPSEINRRRIADTVLALPHLYLSNEKIRKTITENGILSDPSSTSHPTDSPNRESQ